MLRRILLGGVVVFNLFGLAGFALAQTTDTPATSTPTASTTTATDTSASGNVALEDITDTSPTPAVTLATTEVTAKPFYMDMRYIILIIDGFLVIGMILALIGRVLGFAIKAQTPYESQAPEPQKPAGPAKPKQTGPVTLDQLNIDLPL